MVGLSWTFNPIRSGFVFSGLTEHEELNQATSKSLKPLILTRQNALDFNFLQICLI